LDCNEQRYLCLELVDDNNQIEDSDKLISKNYTVKRLNENISKYKVLCCNCLSLKLYENRQKEIEEY